MARRTVKKPAASKAPPKAAPKRKAGPVDINKARGLESSPADYPPQRMFKEAAPKPAAQGPRAIADRKSPAPPPRKRSKRPPMLNAPVEPLDEDAADAETAREVLADVASGKTALVSIPLDAPLDDIEDEAIDQWPASTLERRRVRDLVPYARNARKHSPEQVRQIAASITEFGWTIPVLIDERDGIIAGHGRIMAAQVLGIEDAPVLVARGWSDAKKRAYVIADNQLTLNGEWDDAMLADELAGLRLDGFDLSLTGFTDKEIDQLLSRGSVGLTDPDEAPPLPVVAVSRPGDVWILENHRIACGSCTDPATVAAVLEDEKPHLMVTDPPYGVNYDPAWRKRAGVGGEGTAVGVVMNDDRADWREAWALFPGSVAYVWHGGLHSAVVAESLQASKFGIRSQIIWVKTRFALSRGHYHWQHEPAWYGVRDDDPEQGDRWRFIPEHEVASYAVGLGETAEWTGGRRQSTVWMIEHLKSDTGHGTQKPVECMKRPIENNSAPGDSVYEPFSGSGTTIIAGEMTGRKVRAIELSPAYVDVAVQRWQAFVGKQARLKANGRTFDQVKAERIVAGAS